MNQFVKELGLRDIFQKEEARYAYADSVINALISAQIKALREDRKLSQDELAALIGTKQSGISRLERADYSAWKIETLRRLARAFEVRLRISFEEFGTITDDVRAFKSIDLLPRKFEDDPAFKDSEERAPTAKEAPSTAAATVIAIDSVNAKLKLSLPTMRSPMIKIPPQSETVTHVLCREEV